MIHTSAIAAQGSDTRPLAQEVEVTAPPLEVWSISKAPGLESWRGWPIIGQTRASLDELAPWEGRWTLRQSIERN